MVMVVMVMVWTDGTPHNWTRLPAAWGFITLKVRTPGLDCSFLAWCVVWVWKGRVYG